MEIKHADRINAMIKGYLTKAEIDYIRNDEEATLSFFEEPWVRCNCNLNKRWESYKEDTKISEETVEYCGNCKYKNLTLYEEPCKHCHDHHMWESKEDTKMEKNFTKDMLKDRMVVETRDGGQYLVCGDMLMGTGVSLHFSPYNADLTHGGPRRDERLDIMKVYDKVSFLSDVKSAYCHTVLLWERHEIKEVTLKEIAEKFGVDEVKVIDD